MTLKQNTELTLQCCNCTSIRGLLTLSKIIVRKYKYLRYFLLTLSQNFFSGLDEIIFNMFFSLMPCTSYNLIFSPLSVLQTLFEVLD